MAAINKININRLVNRNILLANNRNSTEIKVVVVSETLQALYTPFRFLTVLGGCLFLREKKYLEVLR